IEPWTARIAAVAHEHVAETRIVDVRNAEHVRHIEKIEHLGDRLDTNALPGFENLRDAQIERREVVAKLKIVPHQRQRDARLKARARIRIRTKRTTRGIDPRQSGVELRA